MAANAETMSSIGKLDESVSSHLQSHVTINSFAAAIRELLQNSIDAQATSILVKIDFATLSVHVQDDGVGMKPEELESLGKRYHTSKLKRLDHLKKVKSFGFRGEAIHSLSSVCELSVISKHPEYTSPYIVDVGGDELATILDVHDTKVNPINNYFRVPPFGKQGTVVLAINLFSNTPVRRTHILKEPKYKFYDEIKEMLVKTLVGHLDVKILMLELDEMKQTKTFINIAKRTDNDFPEILRYIYGSSLLPAYEHVNATYTDFKLKGIIGTKAIQSKKHQFVLINGRPVVVPDDDVKSFNKIFLNADFDMNDGVFLSPKKAVTTVGKPFSKYPVFLINVECPVVISDLLQDPSKTIVHPKYWNIIHKMMNTVFISFLTQQGCDVSDKKASPYTSPKKRKIKENEESIKGSSSNLILNSKARVGLIKPNEINGMLSNSNQPGYEYKPVKFIKPWKEFLSTAKREPSTLLKRQKVICEEFKDDDWDYNLNELQVDRECLTRKNCRIIQQIYQKFILVVVSNANNTKNLLIIDQHACDERCRVEKLFKEFISKVADPDVDLRIKLMKTWKFSITNQENVYLIVHKQNLNSFGIDYEVQEQTLIITHLPELINDKFTGGEAFLKACILQHVYDLSDYGKRKTVNTSNNWFERVNDLPKIIIELIKSKACRSSVMFGDILDKASMVKMVDNLSRCKLPFQCAHGRPTIVPLVNLKK